MYVIVLIKTLCRDMSNLQVIIHEYSRLFSIGNYIKSGSLLAFAFVATAEGIPYS